MIKEVKLSHDSEEIRLTVEVNEVHGITEGSTLEITINNEGIVADLWEVTDGCTGCSNECTATFANTFDEFVELLK